MLSHVIPSQSLSFKCITTHVCTCEERKQLVYPDYWHAFKLVMNGDSVVKFV